MAKLPVILGNLDVTIDNVAPDLTSKAFKFAPCGRHERWNAAPARDEIAHVVCRLVYLVSLPLASVCRLCYLILHSCEAVRCQREDQHLLWSGGVRAVHSQMFSAFHHLQQSPLCLPEALEVRQPKVICKGIPNFYCTVSLCTLIDTGGGNYDDFKNSLCETGKFIVINVCNWTDSPTFFHQRQSCSTFISQCGYLGQSCLLCLSSG